MEKLTFYQTKESCFKIDSKEFHVYIVASDKDEAVNIFKRLFRGKAVEKVTLAVVEKQYQNGCLKKAICTSFYVYPKS